jgi:hypothetical protein
MNFLDAVRELEAGRCKKIISGCITLHEGGEGNRYLLNNADNGPLLFLRDYLADDWELVDPIPQTEEVEVIAWAMLNSEGELCNLRDKEPTTDSRHDQFFKLTGTYTREVKPKVKRRELVQIKRNGEVIGDQPIPNTAKFYAEWEDAP